MFLTMHLTVTFNLFSYEYHLLQKDLSISLLKVQGIPARAPPNEIAAMSYDMVDNAQPV